MPEANERARATDAFDAARRAPWAAAAALLALTLLAYGPSLGDAQFLNFDDNFYFGPEDAAFRAASAAAGQGGVFAGLAQLWHPSAIVADVWLPVAHSSLWLDAWWGGGTPFLPHLTAALLHALAASLFVAVLRGVGVSGWPAFAAAAAFALHPALCESVAWVSGRKDVLCGVFAFAAIRCCLRHGARPGVWPLVGVAACTALAMLSKATAVVVPPLGAIALLCARAPRQAHVATLVSALVCVPLAWLHQHNASLAGTMASGDVAQRLPQVPAAMLHYAATAAWPVRLNVLYPEVATIERLRGGFSWASVALGALLVGTLIASRTQRFRTPALLLFAFFVALAPFNTAFPASVIGVADRYLYLALPWLCAAISLLLAQVRRGGAAVAALCCLALLVATWSRAPEFGSSERLWKASLATDADNAVAMLNLLQARAAARTIPMPPTEEERLLADRAAASARYPEHARRAQLQIAQFALQENRYEAAAQAMLQAVADAERVRDSGRVPRERGEQLLVDTLLASITPLRLAKQDVEAGRAFERCRSLRPGDPRVAAAGILIAVEALATAAAGSIVAIDDARAQQIAQSIAEARATSPDDPQIEYAAALLARVRGQSLAAIAGFRRAAARQPGLVEAWVGAAEVCLERGLAAEAEEYARQAIGLASQASRAADPRLRLCLARALQGQGRLDEAIGSLRDYCDQTGLRDREAARLLSGLLMHKARMRMVEHDANHAELQALVDRALHYNASEPGVDLVRAHMLREQRRFAEALVCLDRLRAALPDLEDTPLLLADCLRDLGYERLIAKDDVGAADAWLRCLQVAPREFETDAIRLQLKGIWRRQEQKGIAARKDGDEAAAQAAFRLCLRVDPSQHWAAWLLVAGLVEDPAAAPEELDALSLQALDGQRQHGLDASRQVAVRALVLRRASRAQEARSLLDGYLSKPDADAVPEVLDVLRKILAELPR